jgi:peptide/nickel transport system substrate-binding protein
MIRRGVLLALLAPLAFAAAGLAPACGAGGENGAGAEAQSPTPGGTLVLLYSQAPSTLNPIVASLASEFDLLANLFPRLTVSEFRDCALTYDPCLAQSWERSADGLSLTYRLRRDFAWHDGTPVTAQDVAFSYELYGDPRTAATRADAVRRIRLPVEAPDSWTARFHFTEPYDLHSQLAHTGLNIVPEHCLEKADRERLRGDPFGRAPVGAGPFRFERWDPGRELVLARSEKPGCRSVPLLEKVVVREIPEYTTRLLELKAGRADMMDQIYERDVEGLLETGEFTIARRGLRALEFIAWNNRHPLFADREVRRALTLAIDRERLMKTFFTAGGTTYARAAIGTVSPETCRALADDVLPLPFDPAAAREALEKAGWKDADGDGVREKEGRRFEFTLLTNSPNDRRKRIQVLVQEMLRNVGIAVELRDLADNLVNSKLQARDYEAAIWGLSAGLWIDLSDQWRSGEGHAYNFSNYANPAVDAAIDRALAAPDPESANAAWKEVQRLVYADQPYTFLYWMDRLVPVRLRFRDVGTDVLSLLSHLERWWVFPGEIRR